MHWLFKAFAVLLLASPAVLRAEQVTLADAVRRALDAHPDLATLAAEVRAREADLRQATRLTNPELELSVENVGANEAETETTAAVGQLVELGGDRAARREAATAALEIARLDLEIRRRELEAEVRRAWTSLTAAQKQVAIARENFASSEEVFNAIRDRVAAGKVSPIEETRAAVALSNERLTVVRAEAELEIARRELAALWGGEEVDATAGDSAENSPAPASLESNPLLRRGDAVVAERKAAVRLARAEAIPDARASAGVRTYEGASDHAAVASITVPLPLLDRNVDAVAAARARVESAEAEKRATRARLTRELHRAETNLAVAREQLTRFSNDIIPAAESVYAAVSEGYRLGKFGYLEVLDARRTLAEARSQLVIAQREVELARIEVERLTGGWK